MRDKDWLKKEIREILLSKKDEGLRYYEYLSLKEALWNAVDQTDFNKELGEGVDKHE